MAGPRQMKPKRRPLPADPSGISPLPQTPPQSGPGTPQGYVGGSDGYDFNSPLPPRSQLQQSPQASPQVQSFRHSYNGSGAVSEERQIHDHYGQYDQREDLYETHNYHMLSQSPQDRYHDQNFPYGPSHDLDRAAPSNRHMSGNGRLDSAGSRANIDPQLLNQPQRLTMAHSETSPSAVDRMGYPVSPVSRQDSYDSTPIQTSPLRENRMDVWPSPEDDMVSREGPPPPPQHRHSGSRSALQYSSRESYHPVPATAPLNIRNDRGDSFSNSPLSQVQSTMSSGVSAMSTSPSRQQQFPHSGSISSISSYDRPQHRRSQSPIRGSDRDREVYGDSMPPSLTPGYDPTIAADESERIMREQRMIGQQTAQGPMPRYQQAAAVPIQQPRAQPIPRGFESISHRRELREHRYSAPIPPTAPVGRSQPVNADPRIPMRKSVSPQPAPGSTDRRHSEVPSQTPFGPDSFDVYNPMVGSADSINDRGARYTTPEEAREATFQHEKQSRLGDGPIIGSDGRVIDPSDHLPSDTWAPEPEQKPAKRGPEVTIRFRHTPQGAVQQPMAPSSNPRQQQQPLHEARPNILPSSSSSSSSPYSHNADATASRTRLQKKPPPPSSSRPGMAQPAPNSSPLIPTTTHTPPRNTTFPRMPTTSDYPLRENHGNYGPSSTGNNHNNIINPAAGGGGYGYRPPHNNNALPPPIPGKVPIGVDQEDWGVGGGGGGGMSALSEEMRRIDIGGVAGRSPPRRTRYHGTRDV